MRQSALRLFSAGIGNLVNTATQANSSNNSQNQQQVKAESRQEVPDEEVLVRPPKLPEESFPEYDNMQTWADRTHGPTHVPIGYAKKFEETSPEVIEKVKATVFRGLDLESMPGPDYRPHSKKYDAQQAYPFLTGNIEDELRLYGKQTRKAALDFTEYQWRAKITHHKYKKREHWEWDGITPEHRSPVLLLYRSILKGLVQMKTFRRKSLVHYTRFMFRKRAAATEKLLIDECIEEARRSVLVIQKNLNLAKTGEFEFDAMTMPKDTGQNVPQFMEEVYDPQMSRQAFEHVQDVTPGNEKYHNQRLAANDGYAQTKYQQGKEAANSRIPDLDLSRGRVSEEAKGFRPPAPKF